MENLNTNTESSIISMEDLLGARPSSRMDKSEKLEVLNNTIKTLVMLKSKVIVNSEMGSNEHPVIDSDDNRETLELWIMELAQELKNQSLKLFKNKK